MATEKPKTFGAAVWIALGLFLVVAIGFPAGMAYVFGSKMADQAKVALAQVAVSMLGFGGAIAAFSFAVFQYRRAEKWKRIEFIAKEIKEFESDPVIQNALLMIDWGARRINLFLLPNSTGKDSIKITRDIQWKALLPHPLKKEHSEYRTFGSSEEEIKSEDYQEDYHKKTFTTKEAKIRDTYDAFLTRLDRFATFIQSGLISLEELKPFLNYWIDAMTQNEHAEDATWRFTLLSYIHFYNYSGVQFLLERFGKDISPASKIYKDLASSVDDKILVERLTRIITSAQKQ